LDRVAGTAAVLPGCIETSVVDPELQVPVVGGGRGGHAGIRPHAQVEPLAPFVVEAADDVAYNIRVAVHPGRDREIPATETQGGMVGDLKQRGTPVEP